MQVISYNWLLTPKISLPVTAILTGTIKNPVTTTYWYATNKCYSDIIRVSKPIIANDEKVDFKTLIFTNPANVKINIVLKISGIIKVFDINGKTLFQQNAILRINNINTSRLINSIYRVHPKLSQQQVIGEDTRPRLSLGRCPLRSKSGATIWDAPVSILLQL